MRTDTALRDALQHYLDAHLGPLDSSERVRALAFYCRGLGLEYPQKTHAALARRLEPDNAEGCRQRMHRAIHRGRFDKNDLFARLQSTIWQRCEAGRAFVIDDTGFAKKGKASPGVARQYSETLGKVSNCQVAVSLHVASPQRGLCIDAQLYLPDDWADDLERRHRAAIPQEIQFATKSVMTLEMLRKALGRGAPNLPVLADAGYGDNRQFRDELMKMGLLFAVAVSSQTTVWPPGASPQPIATTGRRGRPPTRHVDAQGATPLPILDIAQKAWEQGAFESICWRS